MLIFSGTGEVTGGGSPSASDIVVTGNAEVDNVGADFFAFSGGLASGVTGAHGRVYDNVSFAMSFTYPGGQEEFVSGGCRFYARVDADDEIFGFRKLAGATDHLTVRRVVGGTLRVNLEGPNTNFDSGSANISLETWFYLMLYARIHDTAGEFTCKLFDASGALIETLTQTNVDTLNGGNLAETTRWGNSVMDTYVDHLWIDINGAFQGCGYVETLSPASDGDTNSWTRGGTDTGNNWSQVNEVPKNATSYVFSTDADQVELYNFQGRSQAGTPIAVHQVIYVRAHTAGTWEYKPICKIGSTIYEGPTQSTSNTSNGAAPIVQHWQNNPDTGNAWSDLEIDSAQFGVKSVTTDIRLQCVCLHVLVDIS